MTSRIKLLPFSPGKGTVVTQQKLEHSDYVAEFFVNYNTTPAIHHYIITRKDSRAIELWGQTYSEDSCLSEAKGAIDMLALRRARVGS